MIEKMVAVLSHWDDGMIGIYKTVNEAKRQVMYKKCATYSGFYKNKWHGWSYRGGGFEIHKMTETEAEVLFRYNEVVNE